MVRPHVEIYDEYLLSDAHRLRRRGLSRRRFQLVHHLAVDAEGGLHTHGFAGHVAHCRRYMELSLYSRHKPNSKALRERPRR